MGGLQIDGLVGGPRCESGGLWDRIAGLRLWFIQHPEADTRGMHAPLTDVHGTSTHERGHGTHVHELING